MTVNLWMLTGFMLAVLFFAAPIILLLIVRLCGEKQIGNAIIGICVYVNFFGLIYLVILNNVLGRIIPFLKPIFDHPIGNIVMVSVVGALICEAGRYLAIRYVIGDSRTWTDAVGLGAGYGLAATFGVVTDSVNTIMLTNFVNVSLGDGSIADYLEKMKEVGMPEDEAFALLRDLSGMHLSDGLVPACEILMLIMVSLVASVLVLGTVRKNTWFASFPILGYWLAVATHFFADGVPLLLAKVLKLHPYWVILYMLAVTAVAAWFLLFSLRKYPDEGLRAVLKGARKKDPSKKKKLAGEEHVSSISAVATKKTADIDPDEKKE